MRTLIVVVLLFRGYIVWKMQAMGVSRTYLGALRDKLDFLCFIWSLSPPFFRPPFPSPPSPLISNFHISISLPQNIG